MQKKPSIDELRAIFDLFETVPEAQLNFLIDNSQLNEYPEDAYLFKGEDPADSMTLILDGHYRIFLLRDNQKQFMAELSKGDVTGLLPFSRMVKATAYAQATMPSSALHFPRSLMRKMIEEHYELTEVLVHHMNSRIRNFTTLQQQNEKMISLGKLSAGLAHELNNPAAAIARSSQSLKTSSDKARGLLDRLLQQEDPQKSIEKSQALIAQVRSKDKRKLGMLDAQMAQEDWEDYFDDHDLEPPLDLIERLIDYDLSADDLFSMLSGVGSDEMSLLFNYLELELSKTELQEDIESAAARISELVQSIKSFTHMDQGQNQQHGDIREGLDSTVRMLQHKFQKAKIKLVKEYEDQIPKVPLWAGQMNQVYTNLIDNAIDALADTEDPLIKIKVYQKNNNLYTAIEDNGPGIPEEIQASVFDAFFTTKGVGEGTGMGLEISRRIVERHNGSLTLNSRAGQTEFIICLPLK